MHECSVTVSDNTKLELFNISFFALHTCMRTKGKHSTQTSSLKINARHDDSRATTTVVVPLPPLPPSSYDDGSHLLINFPDHMPNWQKRRHNKHCLQLSLPSFRSLPAKLAFFLSLLLTTQQLDVCVWSNKQF